MSATAAVDRAVSTGDASRLRGGPLILWLCLLAVLLGAVAGCGGCRRDPKKLARQKEEEKEKPKPDFEFRPLNTLPGSSQGLEATIKPGHWTSATLELLANNYDFRGQMAVDPVDLDEMPFRLGTARGAILPKGQRRELGLLLFAPTQLNPRTFSLSLATASGRDLFRESSAVTRMPSQQFYLLTLAATPEKYGFLRKLDCVLAPTAQLTAPGTTAHYRPLAPRVKNSVPLSSNSLTWTNIAYLVWDDLDPQLLTPDQRQALLDWLHFGGQLIISGPGSLALLKGSFLDEVLPADSQGTRELAQSDLVTINEGWSPPDAELNLTKPWTAERLTPRPQAHIVAGSGENPLVVDRPLGRGRITVTAFSLSQRQLIDWPGCDSFFNGCLLRRPARRFRWQEETVACHWADGTSINNPRRVSAVRYFSRDAGAWRAWHRFGTRQGPDPASESAETVQYQFQPASFDDPDLGSRYGPGVAGWDDFGEVAQAARTALRDAAGIKIPQPSFVVWSLAAYLLVLVPLNWGVFRAIGRVELAWLAAPMISLAGALLVVRAAQLDIGFVRASNELAVVELQPHYPRAHVTRFTALYTSLSTGYEVGFDDRSALAQPFPDGSGLLRGQKREVVTLRTDEKVRLQGFRVSSNSLGLLHSEHMQPIEGGLVLAISADGSAQVTNRTPWTIESACVLHAGKQAILGRFKPGESKSIELRDIAADVVIAAQPPAAAGLLNVEPLLAIARQDSPPTEWRLIGWMTESLPGVTITPAASQARQVNVIVAHLDYGQTAPQRDVVTRHEIERKLGIDSRRATELDTEEEG